MNPEELGWEVVDYIHVAQDITADRLLWTEKE
jgi:hypothetical protein